MLLLPCLFFFSSHSDTIPFSLFYSTSHLFTSIQLQLSATPSHYLSASASTMPASGMPPSPPSNVIEPTVTRSPQRHHAVPPGTRAYSPDNVRVTRTHRPPGFSVATPDGMRVLSRHYSNGSEATMAESARRVELARQELLLREQEYERSRLREHMARERERQRDHRRERDYERDPQAAPPQRSRQSRSSSGKESHQVCLLNCKSCGNFLSDRGMRAVLLLKPHVTLFSTDVMPANCGPLYPATRSNMCSTAPSEPLVERTCECLTQTLGCYGCGAQVGYHIVSPCARCTESVTEQQRGSNGHRTVLHCKEISVRERRYVPGEPGVRCASPPSPLRTYQVPSGMSASRGSRHAGHGASGSRGSQAERRVYAVQHPGRTTSSGLRVVRIDPEGNYVHPDGEDLFRDLHFELDELDAEKGDYYPSTTSDSDPNSAGRSPRPSSSSSTSSHNGKDAPRRIRRGSRVYWSDLVNGGERCQPIDPDLALDMPVAGR